MRRSTRAMLALSVSLVIATALSCSAEGPMLDAGGKSTETVVPSSMPRPPDVTLGPTVTQPSTNDNDANARPVGAICWSIEELAIATGMATNASVVVESDDQLTPGERTKAQEEALEVVRASIGRVSTLLAEVDGTGLPDHVTSFIEAFRSDVSAVEAEIGSQEFGSLDLEQRTARMTELLTQDRFAFDNYPGSSETMKDVESPGSGCSLTN